MVASVIIIVTRHTRTSEGLRPALTACLRPGLSRINRVNISNNNNNYNAQLKLHNQIDNHTKKKERKEKKEEKKEDDDDDDGNSNKMRLKNNN